MDKKDSFILYTDQKAVLDKLTDEQAGKLIKAIYEYVETGDMPELDNLLDIVITPFKTILDRDKSKYEEVSRIRAEAGSKGGKRNKQLKPNESKSKQNKQLQISESKTSNCDDNDNEYDNEYDNDIKKEINKRKTFDDVLKENKFSKDLEQTLKDFIDMRKTIKKPMTTKALELLIKNLNKLTNLEEEKIAILNQSIEHGWQTVYPLKREKQMSAMEEFMNEYR